MNKLLITVLLTLAPLIEVWADVSVKGYYRSNGTYVKPHMRSRPDGQFSNNWSSIGNTNPYTNQVGEKLHPATSYEKNKNSTYKYLPTGTHSTTSDSRVLSNSATPTKFNNIIFNNVSWKRININSDNIFIADLKKEYYMDGLPLISILFLDGINDFTNSQKRIIKVNCYNYTIAGVTDTVFDIENRIISNIIMTENDEFTWKSIQEVINLKDFLNVSKICD